ncbi:hypothetical protein N7533_008697 [Penicillium manginii]|jgi:hypothetical protein|uniref:uncharacterized protein n=1 Tax=Penicillium manginii TaxID=203109 RepID=UPI0025498D9B|nr:uncharacterized protein N7533_008697 [Penicillium manginii]KAJ5743827.1 hypothetical protein N7533_008697 [Penicillium manginii]
MHFVFWSDSSLWILTHIIVTAYRRSFFSPHYLYILEEDDDIEGYAMSALASHIEYNTSAFHGKTIDDIICLLRGKVTGNKVARNVFYVADDQTMRNHSLLLVHVKSQEQDEHH